MSDERDIKYHGIQPPNNWPIPVPSSPLFEDIAKPSSPILPIRVVMDFPDALRLVMDGKRITKQEWGDRDTYGLLDRGLLVLHKGGEPDYQYHGWLINDGDLFGDDWVAIT